jgi:hypothetical protein
LHIAARQGGGALLVWDQAFVDTSLNSDEIFFRELDGAQWSPIQNISNSPSFSRAPMVISDHHGGIHTLWLEKLGGDPRSPRGYNDIFYSYRTGKLWSEPESIYHTDFVKGISPGGMDITLDNENGLHILWSDPESPSTLYTRRDRWAGTLSHWNTPRAVFRGGMADMTIDGTNKLHVVVVHTLGPSPVLPKAHSPQKVNDLFYSFSVDGGRSWANRILVHDSGTQPAFFPRIVVDRTLRIHILWAKDYDYNLFPDDILHSFSTDGSYWSEPVSITRLNTGISFPPAVVVDQNNRIHAVWQWAAYFGSEVSLLYYAQWENDRWAEPVRLFESAFQPTLCLDAFSTLHLAWINARRISEDRVETRILYSQASLVSSIGSSSAIPSSFQLDQNSPNPFNVETVIRYWLPLPAHVRLKVYDVSGKEIRRLRDEVSSAGFHEARFDGSWLPSGVYFYQLEAAGYRMVKKMVVLR